MQTTADIINQLHLTTILMEEHTLFATIDLIDRRKIIIRNFMPTTKLRELARRSQLAGFSYEDLKEYAEYDVTVYNMKV